MNIRLEIMKLEGELKSVDTQRHNMLTRIEVLKEEIETLLGHVETQNKAETDTKTKLDEMRKK